MQIRWLPAVIAALSFASINTASSAQLNQVIVFGDSNVDTGFFKALSSPGGGTNYNAAWPTAVAHGAGAPVTSPGLNKSQVLAAYFGLTANPSNTAAGTNYATSGAKNLTVNTTATGGFGAAIPTATQMQNYLSANGGAANSQALFFIYSGDNDVNYAVGEQGTTPPQDPAAYVIQAANDLATAIIGLRNAGARNLLVATLAYSYPSNNSLKRALRLSYSNTLVNALTSAGVAFKRADANAALSDIIANRVAYGFDYVDTNAGHTACNPVIPNPLGSGTVTITTAWSLLCSSDPAAPSQYVSSDAPQKMLFADDGHYATKGQQIIGNYLIQVASTFGKAAHDFNGDAKSDIVWRNSAGDNAMWLMNGATIVSVAGLVNVTTNWYVVGQRDFNGDGKTDLLWASTTGDVAIWLMNGSTITSVASLGNVGANWGVAGTADFNGDGKGDILWRNLAGDNAIWLMNGATLSSVAGLGNVPTNWSIVGTADFDADGKGDIIWRNSGGDNAIWLMNGTTIASVAGLGNIPTNWSVVSNGDYNGDGKGDILWRNSAGDNAIWFMNGTTLSSISGLGNVPTNWTIQNAAAN